MSKAMIVAPQPEAVEAGAVILAGGGNAVDAAIACALVQGVVDPLMAGIAGFGSFQVFMPGRGVHGGIDFHGRVPAAATPDMWADLIEGEARDGFGFILRDYVNDIGYQAVTVPGSLRAYSEAAEEYGTLPWREIVAPAIRQAEAGFAVRPHVHRFWTEANDFGRAPNVDRLRFSATGRRIFCDANGMPKAIGARVENPDMARSLRRIADDGADVFYTGEIAQAIDADMRANGGLLSLEDLANYRTKRTEPIEGEYRGLRVTTNQPPGGGIMLVEMLNILETFDLAALGHNTPEYIRVVCEAMKRATNDKDAHVSDPDFVEVPVDRLTSKDYAAGLAEEIRRGEKARVDRLAGPPESKNTTHVSVIDREGNAVAMTHSLGMPSGTISDGLGFMYNGCMAVFDPRPGRTGSIVPGKSRFSSICPTIILRDGKPFIIIGAPGGTQIAMGVLQAILNAVDFGMSMSDAVSAPRFSSTSNLIDVSNRIPNYICAELERQGYEIARSPLSYGFGAVHGIKIDGDGVEGGADPGHDGMALAV